MPIRVVVVDDNTVNACTSPGGYQYIRRGLLTHAESEGELAAVLAHGIAETALHTPTRQQLRSLSSSFRASDASPSDEFDADYFGIQYFYQSGYRPLYY